MLANPDALFQEALQLHQSGRVEEALRLYERLLVQSPLHSWAWHYRGVAELQRGRKDLALRFLRIGLVVDPAVAVFHGNMGEAVAPDDQKTAATFYRRSIACEPSFSSAYGNLIGRCQAVEPFDGLLRFARRHASLEPSVAAAQSNLGVLLIKAGVPAFAVDALARATWLDPGSARIYVNLANACELADRGRERVAALESAARLDPLLVGVQNNLGRALHRAGRLGEALRSLRRAVALEPSDADALNNLGVIASTLCDAEAASAWGARAIVLAPMNAAFVGNRVMSLLYRDFLTSGELFAALGGRSEDGARHPTRGKSKSGEGRPLRLGLVSADLRHHAVGETLLSVIEAIDRREAEVYLYANVARPDEVSERFASLSDGWRLIADRSDDEVVSDVRRDGIDVLVSVAGHTAGGRLPVFASRAAPVQASLYDLTTTGLEEMDYWIGDEATTPVGTPELFSETILRLPCWYVFRRPPAEPPVSTVPALASGRVTFGCFNNPAKLSPSTLSTWAAVMQAVPGSRLLLKYLHFYEDQSLRAHIRSSFARSGVSADRIEFEVGSMAGSAHLSIYHHVDIALDPFPFVGCNATFQALWMGVPVVTLAGERFIARMGAGFLPLVGLDRLVAADHRSYVDIAAGLANDLPALAALRATLRDRVIASPLCDAHNYAKSLVAALRAG